MLEYIRGERMIETANDALSLFVLILILFVPLVIFLSKKYRQRKRKLYENRAPYYHEW